MGEEKSAVKSLSKKTIFTLEPKGLDLLQDSSLGGLVRLLEKKELIAKESSKFIELIKLMAKGRVKKYAPIDLYSYASGNLYVLAHVFKESSVEQAREYFGGEIEWKPRVSSECSPVYNDEVTKLVRNGTTVRIQYMKRFNGLIQIAGFGVEWEKESGTCWALYGHLVSEKDS